MTPEGFLEQALKNIRAELEDQIKKFKDENKILEAYRIDKKTNYDLEMIEQIGYCNGIENYSRHLENRASGTPPATLMDFFLKIICFSLTSPMLLSRKFAVCMPVTNRANRL